MAELQEHKKGVGSPSRIAPSADFCGFENVSPSLLTYGTLPSPESNVSPLGGLIPSQRGEG